jgi:predicted dehydrogenase
MPVAPHHSMAHRSHEVEEFHSHFFTFPGNRFVVDMTSNAKGLLGRHPRPGYTQIEGERGTIVWRAASRWNGPYHQGEGEIRYCSDDALETNGIADTVYPIICKQENEFSKAWYVHLPTGPIEYVNQFYQPTESLTDAIDFYHAASAEHVMEFAATIRGAKGDEFSDEDALMSMTMATAIRESILQNGAYLPLPLSGPIESEERERATLRQELGVDPLDIEAMLDRSIARV